MKRKVKLVGVGASAGGLNALIDFFKAVPGDCDAAFLVLQHLSPDRESRMAELLAPHASLEVVEASDGQLLGGGTIYLCPPGTLPRVDGLTLSLWKRPGGQSVYLPIDILFESMGRTLGASCAAVVLSGTGSDGSAGIQSVYACGGIVGVQRPESADFTGMPQSAISTGCYHFVATSGKIWHELNRLAEGGEAASSEEDADLSGGEEPPPFEASVYAEIFNFLEGRFGLNFSLYRLNSVGRRLDRRMKLLAQPDLSAYLEYLEKNSDEAKCLYQDLLIGVTRFFRDEENFNVLSRDAIRAAMAEGQNRDFRIWSAGCATGQEAYSLYILADEVRRETGFPGRVKVIATDAFKPSLDFAGKGIYEADELAELDQERKERYFTKLDSGHYKIQARVRENIIFARHDFLSDATFTKMDVVSCRNVLIYLKPETQEAALGAFSYALRDRGFLFLGSSERLGKFESAYKALSKKAKVFRKRSNQLDSGRWSKKRAAYEPGPKRGYVASSTGTVAIKRDLLNAYDSLLERFAPCGFLVDARREVLHYFGNAADYCIHVEGRATQDLAEQLDKRLRHAVTALMHRAGQRQERILSNGLHCQSKSGERVVDLAVEPLKDAHGDVVNYLIEIHARDIPEARAVEPVDETAEVDNEDVDAAGRMQLLEDELKATRENLEAANEELQVSNEELQAVNEEFQVSNEELQSTNEELHSLNE